MNLAWFKTFIRIAETRSFSQAAQELNLTQPAVSKHITTLETFYGLKLIDRSRRSVILTEAGAALLPFAQKILSAVAEAAQEMDSFLHNVKGTLTIGASTIPGHYVLPRTIRRFREEYPEVNINLEIADTGKIIRRVMEGGLSLGAVGALKPVPTLEAVPFKEDELVLTLPVGHPLARRKAISTAALTGQEFVWRESESGTRDVTEKRLRSAGINPENLRIVAELGSTEAVLAAVEAGLGLSFVSRRAAENRAKNGRLVMRRVQGLPLKRTLYLIYPRNRPLSRPVKAFINFVTENQS